MAPTSRRKAALVVETLRWFPAAAAPPPPCIDVARDDHPPLGNDHPSRPLPPAAPIALTGEKPTESFAAPPAEGRSVLDDEIFGIEPHLRGHGVASPGGNCVDEEEEDAPSPPPVRLLTPFIDSAPSSSDDEGALIVTADRLIFGSTRSSHDDGVLFIMAGRSTHSSSDDCSRLKPFLLDIDGAMC